MRVIVGGDKARCGRRQVDCRYCGAILEITAADVKSNLRETESFQRRPVGPLRDDDWHFWVNCGECGYEIKVKNKMEN